MNAPPTRGRRIITFDVRHDDPEQIVDVTAHAIELDDFLYTGNRTCELLQPFVIVLVGLETDEDRSPDIEFFGIKQRDPAPDHPFFLQLLNAPPTRGRRQADAPRDFGQRQGCVFLEAPKNFTISVVHRLYSY